MRHLQLAVSIAICCTPLLPAYASSQEPTSASRPIATSSAIRSNLNNANTMPPATTRLSISPKAFAYIDEALDYMQNKSVMRDKVNWSRIRQGTIARAEGVQNTADTYPAIEWALQQLGDHHSFLLTPDEAKAIHQKFNPDSSFPKPQARQLRHNIGYINLPPFEGSDSKAIKQYTTFAIRSIQQVDAKPICGWVVDLRNATGGNMWPLLAAVGPVLGNGKAGEFVYPDGRRDDWHYSDGKAMDDGHILAEGPVYHLKQTMSPVAVLTSRFTASSGEAIAVAFRGRPNTRSFGEPTLGLPIMMVKR